VIVLKNNFDRLSVLAVTAEVTVDDDDEDDDYEDWYESGGSDDGGEEGRQQGEEQEERKRRLWSRGASIGGRRGSRGAPQRAKYKEAVGEARLAWRWVEGWRARLRKGGDVVEKARWEWRLDRQKKRESSMVPAVVVNAPEVPVSSVRGRMQLA
jgi:hypothetical protein